MALALWGAKQAAEPRAPPREAMMAIVVEQDQWVEPPPPAAPSAPPVLEVDNIRLGYEDRDIISGLNLGVTPGQVYGLVGPSGGGKTTLLRAALGLLEPKDGEARLFGHPALELPSRLRRRVAYVPQSFTLYPNLSIAENLDFVAGLYGMGWRHRRRRMRHTLEAMDLWEHRRKLARELSGGMQRRLQMAAAFLHEPDLLLVDEPTAGIDPILRARCWDEFRAIADAGRTVFFTTQYVNEAELCDYVALVAGGGLLAEGTPAKLRRDAYGGDVIDLTAAGLGFGDAEVLQELSQVSDVEYVGRGRLRLRVDDAARATPEIARALEDRGRRVEAMDTNQPSFDEVFTHLVQNADTARSGE
jgi:ABC-2 type transport system ATP-binding protein